ncbi:MAG: Holliday junction branch migration protein RuvA [Alphaproteobacteria bacterium]
MIGKLSGIIDSFAPTHMILDVGGVGYLVNASQRTLGRIGQKGEPASLLIETAVREDAITLYGFIDAAEQSWFKLLTSVQGVGAKAALAILSVAPPEKIGLAIAAQDKTVFTQADGVGPKLATRILTELKDKAANMDLSPSSAAPAKFSTLETQTAADALDQDAVSALVNLGYARTDAYTAVARAKDKANDNLQTLIRLALKELSA